MHTACGTVRVRQAPETGYCRGDYWASIGDGGTNRTANHWIGERVCTNGEHVRVVRRGPISLTRGNLPLHAGGL